MKKLLIIGGGGHGTMIASCLKSNQAKGFNTDVELVGYINDYETFIEGLPVIAKTSDIPRLVGEGYLLSWSIHLICKNKATYEAYQRMAIPEDSLYTIVHHSAEIEEDVVLEPGCTVMAHTYIGPRSHIGKGTMVKPHASIGHDVVCGPLCHFARGSITGSHVNIGICSDVALGATVIEKRNIGNFAMAGARSLITKSIPDGEIHIGSPARYMRHTEGFYPNL